MLPRVVLLDLDDTILDDTGGVDGAWRGAIGELAPARGVDPERLRAEVIRVSTWFWSDPERHRVGRLDLVAARCGVVADALGASGVDDEDLAAAIVARYSELRHEAIAPLPGALDALGRLRAAGVALGLITNGAALPQRAKVERFGLTRYFGYVGIEGEVGVGKPEPAAFTRALAQLDCGADEAWMVGDRLDWDVAGAQAVGIHAIWVDLAGSGLPAAAPVSPDRIVRGIAELA